MVLLWMHCLMVAHYWRNHWHAWRVLNTYERGHLEMSWCAIPRTFYRHGVFSPTYFEDMRTLSSISILSHHSYWIAPFCDAILTRGFLWWSYLGHRHKISSRIGGWPHGQTICLCGQLSNVHPCILSHYSSIDGVVPTTITTLWIFFMSSL